MRHRITRHALLAVVVASFLACDSGDDTTDDTGTGDGDGDGDGMTADDGGDGDGMTATGGDGGGGTDNPYGACETAADCPVEGSRCPGSSGGCLPPCEAASDCPAVAGFMVTCEGGTCGIPCSASSPCPAGMTCLAGITCGWP